MNVRKIDTLQDQEESLFTIFEPDGKSFHLTPNWIILLFGFLPLCIFAISQYDLKQNNTLSTSIKTYLICMCGLSIYFLLTSNLKYKPLNGKLVGKINFDDKGISVNNIIYELKDIIDLDFSLTDYYGKSSMNGRDLNPKLSQGVDNSVSFIDKTGKSYVVNFQLTTENHYQALSTFIIEAVKADKMQPERGIELMKKRSYWD